MVDKLKNGVILGGIAGLLLTYPQLSVWVGDFLAETIPASWQLFGSFSLPLYGVAIGLVVGYVIDKK